MKKTLLVLLMLVSLNLRGTVIPARSVQMDPQPTETAPIVTVLPNPFQPEEGGTAGSETEPETTAWTVDPSCPMVALTFDDGPHPVYTDQLLDILEENGTAATFFEVGQKLSCAPETVRRAEKLGCEIGSHSYRHANLGKMDPEALEADLVAADAAFKEVLGAVPTLLRPPYGATSKALKEDSGRSIVTWSVDPQDWKSRDAEQVVAHIQGAGDLDGQVILLHSPYESSVEATRTLVPWLREQGYQLVTVSELITLRFGDTLEPNRLYNYDYFRRPPALPENAGEGQSAA